MANIVKAHILGAEEGAVDAAGRSTQLPEDTWDYQKTGAKEPPYNLDALCVFLEINTWHYRCFPPGTLVMLEGGIEKPIEDVREGDRAIAADGRAHTVFRTMCRPHSGQLVGPAPQKAKQRNVRIRRMGRSLACGGSGFVRSRCQWSGKGSHVMVG
jgi:hypothetical protein